MVTYRSTRGLVVFGVWVLAAAALSLFVCWGAVTGGELPLSVAAWTAGIPMLGVYWTFLELSVTPHGDLEFRGVLRRRRWHASQVRTIRPGTGCMVFRFDRGSAMLAAAPSDPNWTAVVERIHAARSSPPAEHGPGGTARR